MIVIRILLFPFSILYLLITGIRTWAFNVRIMRSAEFDLPTICVGNLSTGGTGKSPHTEYLIRLLKDEFKVATLSRGYGRSKSGFHLVNKNSTVADCGDEPLQFKSKFPHIEVAVNAKRVDGVIEILQQKEQTEVILLDDAYQHRAIKAGKNILLTEFNRPYFKDWILPSGNLRELAIGRTRADYIIVTKCPDQLSDEKKAAFALQLKAQEHQKVFFTSFKYGAIRNLDGSEHLPDLSQLANSKVLLITGIANPKPLCEKLNSESIGYEHLKFPDHHKFKAKDLEKIRNLFDTFEGEKTILTTEKDAQRLKAFKEFPLPIHYVEIEVVFQNDEHTFRSEILEYVRNNKIDSGISSREDGENS